uniref:hypothetical protein n=1 Tax=Pedobacter sp. Leaf170 TaxID=2876558 RepID=UPI001E5E982C
LISWKEYHHTKQISLKNLCQIIGLNQLPKISAKKKMGWSYAYAYSKRKIDDPDLLGIIMLQILEVYELVPDNYPIILSTAYWFVAPSKILYKELKLKIGFRSVIQQAMGFNNPESVSMNSTNLDVYYKNPRFKQKVHDVGERILKELQESGYMEKDRSEWGTE